jgi:hypothetical protein
MGISILDFGGTSSGSKCTIPQSQRDGKVKITSSRRSAPYHDSNETEGGRYGSVRPAVLLPSRGSTRGIALHHHISFPLSCTSTAEILTAGLLAIPIYYQKVSTTNRLTCSRISKRSYEASRQTPPFRTGSRQKSRIHRLFLALILWECRYPAFPLLLPIPHRWAGLSKCGASVRD